MRRARVRRRVVGPGRISVREPEHTSGRARERRALRQNRQELANYVTKNSVYLRRSPDLRAAMRADPQKHYRTRNVPPAEGPAQPGRAPGRVPAARAAQ